MNAVFLGFNEAHIKVAKVLRITLLPHFIRCYRSFSSSVTTTATTLPYKKKLIRTSLPPMDARPGLKTYKLDTDAYWRIFTPELTNLVNTFKKYDYDLRIAGGAVRDLIMDIVPEDIDFASTATPPQMKEMFEKEHIRMLHKKGEEHGTITCRINEKQNFEVTTLRVDVVCDGRRAEVGFTHDWEADAFRRDLTVNSLYLDFEGIIYDYTGGKQDVDNRIIKFVGDAVSRIQEDYLRILRYFRFFGRIAATPTEHDPETIKAVIENKEGLKSVSGERIWSEFKRIVVGRYASEVIQVMLDECKLHPYLGLKEDVKLDKFTEIFDLSVQKNTEGYDLIAPCTVLTSLFLSDRHVMDFHKKCRISNHEKILCMFVIRHREEARENRGEMLYFKNLLMDEFHLNGQSDFIMNRFRIMELMKYVDAYDLLQEFQEWQIPKMPLNGIHLMEAGVPKGKYFKYLLEYLYGIWKESQFTMTFEDLIQRKDDEFELPEDDPKLTNGPSAKRQRKK
jgi:tRNA nucleotidyltransferase (CCA-adding enzyme)